jgi:hypothetical protein
MDIKDRNRSFSRKVPASQTEILEMIKCSKY